MTKAEVVNQIYKKIGVEKEAISTIVEELMGTIKTAMANGENVYLRGFGTFDIVKRAEKTARNIGKNTTVIVPAHNIPHFKPCKEFVNEVRENVK